MNDLILDDLVKPANKAMKQLREQDYMYPESINESNPAYALHLESIGAKFYEDHPIKGRVNEDGKMRFL